MNRMDNPLSNRLSRIPPAGWMAIVAVIAVLERIALWLAYPPVIFDDTNSYRRLAGQILGSAPFDGTRSPGYPIFLAWLGPDKHVYAVQLVLGLGTTLLFFYLGWLVSDKGWIGAAAALIHTLNIGQLLFEADLLAETLTTFFAMLTLCCGVYLLKQEQASGEFGLKQFGIALLAGTAGGLAALVRPQFVFLPFLVAFVLVLQAARKSLPDKVQSLLSTKNTKENLKSSSFELFVRSLAPSAHPARGTAGQVTGVVSFVVNALSFVVKNALWANKKLWALVFAIIIPAILLNAVWVNYIHTQFGVWSMSSVDGYHLIQHTGKFFEYVPDEDAAIRDTFLRYRAVQIAHTGNSSNTIWAALPELQKVSGLGFYRLSRKLQEISLRLIREHPLLYLGSVLEAWAGFWSAPFYWNPQGFGAAQAFFSAVVQFQRALLWAANTIFIVGTFALVFQRVRKTLAMPPSLWLVLAIVWANSILQALVEASENPRYSVSTQTLVLLVVGWWVWQIIHRWGQHNETF